MAISGTPAPRWQVRKPGSGPWALCPAACRRSTTRRQPRSAADRTLIASTPDIGDRRTSIAKSFQHILDQRQPSLDTAQDRGSEAMQQAPLRGSAAGQAHERPQSPPTSVNSAARSLRHRPLTGGNSIACGSSPGYLEGQARPNLYQNMAVAGPLSHGRLCRPPVQRARVDARGRL
jgi:hypothetical protein